MEIKFFFKVIKRKKIIGKIFIKEFFNGIYIRLELGIYKDWFFIYMNIVIILNYLFVFLILFEGLIIVFGKEFKVFILIDSVVWNYFLRGIIRF